MDIVHNTLTLAGKEIHAALGLIALTIGGKLKGSANFTVLWKTGSRRNRNDFGLGNPIRLLEKEMCPMKTESL